MTRIQKRRRTESKTDYKARLALLKSNKPRLVIRKTNRYIIAQIVESENALDKTISSFNSKELIEKGWPKNKSGSLKSLPAAYLTGFFLIAQPKQKIKEAVLDIGLQRNTPKSRIYSALKGAIDAGLKISYNAKSLPEMEQLKKSPELSQMLNKIQKEAK